MEEVGELAAALREGTKYEQALEFADVLAWLATIANVAGIDLRQAVHTVRPGLSGMRPVRLPVRRQREAMISGGVSRPVVKLYGPTRFE